MNVDLRLVSKLSSPAPDSELSSEIVAFRDAVKVLTDRVVANTQFPDKPSAPAIPPSSSSFSSTMTDLQKYMDVAEGKNKDYYEDKEIDDTLSSAAKNWEIIVNTDNLFTSTTAVLRFPRFPTHSEFLYLMRQLTRPTSTAADLRPPNLLMEVQDGRFEGKYESFDTLRVSSDVRNTSAPLTSCF